MQIIISCAKNMTAGDFDRTLPVSMPHFLQQALCNVRQMTTFDAKELMRLFKCSQEIADLNVRRYHDFSNERGLRQAALSYTGMAYRHLRGGEFTPTQASYANHHLWITSFLYGLLRPMDLIKNYRMEGNIKLPDNQGKSMFDFWKPLLTDFLIENTLRDDGILVHLATLEMERLFDWKKIEKELILVEPQFYNNETGKMKIVSVQAKMCRGAMARFIIEQQCTSTDQLGEFSYEGYRCTSTCGVNGGKMLFVNG